MASVTPLTNLAKLPFWLFRIFRAKPAPTELKLLDTPTYTRFNQERIVDHDWKIVPDYDEASFQSLDEQERPLLGEADELTQGDKFSAESIRLGEQRQQKIEAIKHTTGLSRTPELQWEIARMAHDQLYTAMSQPVTDFEASLITASIGADDTKLAKQNSQELIKEPAGYALFLYRATKFLQIAGVLQNEKGPQTMAPTVDIEEKVCRFR